MILLSGVLTGIGIVIASLSAYLSFPLDPIVHMVGLFIMCIGIYLGATK